MACGFSCLLLQTRVHPRLGAIHAFRSHTSSQDVVGKDATSMEDVLLRMQKAVEQDKVETLVMTVSNVPFEELALPTVDK